MQKSRWLLTGLVLTVALAVTGLRVGGVDAASPDAVPLAQCAELVTDGGFETGTGWTLGPNAAMPYYQSYAVHSGSRALVLGIPAGGNLKSFSSARQTVTIPAGSGQALLTFWFYAIAEAPATTDYMEFVVLDPGGNILGKPWNSHNDSRVWNQMTLDLAQWRGQTIQLYFNVYNDGLGGKAAMFLDDVSLAVCGGPGPGTWTPTPTGTFIPPTATGTFTPATPTFTPTPPPGPVCMELVQNGSFTALQSNWEAEGNLAGVGIAASPEPVRTAPHSLRLGSTGAVINGLSTARQLISVPAGYGQVTLEAWVYPQAQINQGADYQELAILNSSGVLITAPWRVVGTTGGWTRLAFNIAQFAGQSIYIRFGVFNDGQGGQTVLYVDDVSVQACTGAPIPVTATPSPTSSVTVVVPATATPTPTYVPPPTYYPPPTYIPPPTGCIELTQNPSFEYGLYPWQPGHGNLLPAQLVNAPVVGGSWAVQLGSRTQNRYTYSSIRQWLTVPGGYPQKVVSFYAYTYTESYAGADEQKFVVLGPGDAVLAVPWKTLDNAQTWQHFVFDLSSVTSNQFAIYFAAINDGVGGRTALFIDEVHAYACTPGAVWPVPYQAPLGAADAKIFAAEEPYPYADTPAMDPDPLATEDFPPVDGELAPGLTPVAEPVLTEVEPEVTVEEAVAVTPPPAWTEIAIDGTAAADLTALGTPEAIAIAEATAQAPALAQSAPTAAGIIVPTPRIEIETNTPARAPGFIERIGNTLSRATASWPQGGRTLVTIVLGLAILAVVVLVIGWLIRRLRGL
jgi:hypothetical protein